MNLNIDIPAEANDALSAIREQLAAKGLAAVYLHGSAVAGGLRPHSDVDLIAVVDRAMTPEVGKLLAAGLMKISGHYPFDPEGRRPLEVIVFLRDDLAASLYPARGEFVYGEWLRRDYESGKIPQPACDPELTLVLAQAGREAVSLAGPDVGMLLPVIPQSLIRRAIGESLPALVETLEGDERNVLLTLARMWRTSVTGEFVSKDAAAVWAAERLQTDCAEVLAAAREAYLGLGESDWLDRRKAIRQTAEFLRGRIMERL